jgi:hypothetical protein
MVVGRATVVATFRWTWRVGANMRPLAGIVHTKVSAKGCVCQGEGRRQASVLRGRSAHFPVIGQARDDDSESVPTSNNNVVYPGVLKRRRVLLFLSCRTCRMRSEFRSGSSLCSAAFRRHVARNHAHAHTHTHTHAVVETSARGSVPRTRTIWTCSGQRSQTGMSTTMARDTVLGASKSAGCPNEQQWQRRRRLAEPVWRDATATAKACLDGA